MSDWQYERLGDWVFRVRKGRNISAFISECKRGEFSADSCLQERGDVWFEFGKTAEEAMRKLKIEIFG